MRTNNNNTTVRSKGIGFFGLLTLLFIGLKLTGYITWSWLWVLAPSLIPLMIGSVIIISIFIMYLIDRRN